jgi:hypothetical protein
MDNPRIAMRNKRFVVEQKMGDGWEELASFDTEADARKFWLDPAQAPAPVEVEETPSDEPRAATWFELARDLKPGSRVKFVTSWDIFPECIVPAGTLGTVKDTGLNEIWGGLLIIPDDEAVRAALKEWDGEIQLGYNEGLDPGVEDASTDPAWQAESPLVVVTDEPAQEIA